MKGYFDNANQEYVITDLKPKRPLINYLWNDSVVARLNHFGFGNCVAAIGSVRRPFIDGERHIYIKRQGVCYSANRNYDDLPFTAHRTHVGLGYQRIVSEYKGLRVETTVCVPFDGYAEITNVKFVNVGGDVCDFDAYFYLRLAINTTWHVSYSRSGWDGALDGLYYSHNGFPLDESSSPHDYNTVFVKTDTHPMAWDTTNTEFLGHYGSTAKPAGVLGERLLNRGATFEEYCAALQYKINLRAGEEKSVNIAVGLGRDNAEAAAAASRYCSQSAYLKLLEGYKAAAAKYTDVFKTETPDEYLNTMVNIWLKRQISLGKTWGRVYGKGFRDVMQDIASFVSFDPPLAKKLILNTLKYQFTNGNTIRQFDPIFDAPYNDGAAWIPATLLSYICESGDLGILSEQVGYYDGEKTESVFEHLTRGIGFLTTNLGKHGLSLWGGGDWNDSLNNCGKKGVGESVWLSIAAVKAVKEYAEIAALINIDASGYLASAEKLTQNILKHGFEGDRFIYGYNDYGEKIGSADSEQAEIYLNPQTWAVLAGIATGELAVKVFSAAEKYLKTKFGYKQCYPSYSRGTEKIGRASYFVEGVYENGSVYNHGVMFKLVADCLLGRGSDAYNTFLMLRHDNPDNLGSGVEPYAVSNMYIGDECPYPHQIGYSPMSWITGSAGWLYRGLTEYLLGVKPTLNGLEVKPTLPDGWDNIAVTRRFRGAVYDITICRGEAGFYVDGKKQDGSIASYDGLNHTVKVFVP